MYFNSIIVNENIINLKKYDLKQILLIFLKYFFDYILINFFKAILRVLLGVINIYGILYLLHILRLFKESSKTIHSYFFY